MRIFIGSLLGVVLWIVTYLVGHGSAKDTRYRLRLKKPDIVDLKFIEANNWRYVMRNNGSYMYDSPDADGDGNNAGGEFPRGSGETIFFAGSLWVGTLKNGISVVSEGSFAKAVAKRAGCS